MKTQKIKILLASVFIMLASTISIQAYAGGNCEIKAANPFMVAQASSKALEVRNILQKNDPQVALIARVGSDMSKYNIHYTHLAFVVRDFQGKQGSWRVVHLLNECGTSRSSIYAQGLMNFFMDDLHSMDYRVIIPKPDLQKKIMQAFKSQQVLRLHDPQYSMLAYPFSTRYQNSNQWGLEVLAAAKFDLRSRQDIQKALVQTRYIPAVIRIAGLTKFGAGFYQSIKFDDHPRNERDSDKYSVVTVDSVVNYLSKINETSFDKVRKG